MSQNNQAQSVAIRTTPPALVWAQGQDEASALCYTRQSFQVTETSPCTSAVLPGYPKLLTILSLLPVHMRMSKEVLNCRGWGVPMSLTEALPTPNLASFPT